MKKNFIIIGLGRFGKNVALSLEEMKEEVLAVDVREDVVSDVARAGVTNCVVADATKLDVLKELGADTFDHAVVAIGNNLEASILAATNLRKLGVRRITVRVDEDEHKEIFKLLGANEIIIPEEAAGIDLANQVYSDAILESHIISGDFVMAKVINNTDFGDRDLIKLDLRNRCDVNIVGLIRNEKFFIPKGTDIIALNDIIVVVGQKAKIRKFAKNLENL